MADSRQGIGLLGGSFDPVHNGHLAIAQSFLESDFISELWVLLTPDPPHKEGKKVNDYEQRLKMLRTAFRDMDRVVVSNIEDELPRPSYTIQTLEYLREKYPKHKFYLCIGEDSVHHFKEWKDWEKILGLCELLVARRPSDKEVNLDSDLVPQTYFVDHEPVDISSTRIRNFISKGQDISDLVPEKVQEIIERERLYQNG